MKPSRPELAPYQVSVSVQQGNSAEIVEQLKGQSIIGHRHRSAE